MRSRARTRRRSVIQLSQLDTLSPQEGEAAGHHLSQPISFRAGQDQPFERGASDIVVLPHQAIQPGSRSSSISSAPARPAGRVDLAGVAMPCRRGLAARLQFLSTYIRNVSRSRYRPDLPSACPDGKDRIDQLLHQIRCPREEVGAPFHSRAPPPPPRFRLGKTLREALEEPPASSGPADCNSSPVRSRSGAVAAQVVAARQEVETVVQFLGDLRDGQHFQPRRRQFDGQRDPVQVAADLDDRTAVLQTSRNRGRIACAVYQPTGGNSSASRPILVPHRSPRRCG